MVLLPGMTGFVRQDVLFLYKENKERLIKEVADKYRDKIPEKLYNALINWEVEYTD